MAKRNLELHIYNDAWMEMVFLHALDAALNSPVRYRDIRRADRKKTSSRHDSSENARHTYIAYQFRGYPSAEQEAFLKQNIGSCRFLWNRMFADRKAVIVDTGKDSLRPRPAQYKDEFPWLRNADSYGLCNVQLSLDGTFSSWKSGKCGFPKFKKKHACRDSYTTNRNQRTGNISLGKNGLHLPKIPGLIRVTCHRKVRPGGILKSVTVSHEPDGKWLFSLLFEYPAEERADFPDWIREFSESGDLSGIRCIGLDMSLPHLYVDSNGNFPFYTLGGKNGSVVPFDKCYRKLEKKIAHEQRKLSHMVKGSHNYEKQLVRIASLHAKAKHARRDFLRQMAARLSRQYHLICIEDLDMRAMKQALKFGKSVSDNGWSMFIVFLEAACEKTGSLVIRVSKWFPSSKRCSRCGFVRHDLKLNERTYVCPECGSVMDRDAQAAVNIREEGLHLFADIFDPGRHVKMMPA